MKKLLIIIILVFIFVLLFTIPVCAEEVAEIPEGANVNSLLETKNDPFVKNIEWFGMNIGGGVTGYTLRLSSSYDSKFMAQYYPVTDLLLFNIQYKKFYCTILEFHPWVIYGYLGGGVRLGRRIELKGSYKQELRLGAYLGFDSFYVGAGAVKTFALRPHIQFVHNTDHGSVGVGMDFPINVIFGEIPRDARMSNAAGGAILYFRFTVGRTSF